MGRWFGDGQVKIAKEVFTAELAAEILPLGQKCWEESTKEKGERCAFYGEREFQIEPNTELYQKLSDIGQLVIVTLRDEGLKGYVIGFTYQAMHHKKIRGGIGDSMYVEPDYRSYIAVMVELFEREMRELGVNIIGWPTQEGGAVYQVLKARGYVGDDIVMEKRLCA